MPSLPLIHIGYPKTASTSLQRNYFSMLPNTLLLGESSASRRRLFNFKNSCYGTSSSTATVSRVISDRSEAHVLLSDELILGANRRITEQRFLANYLMEIFGSSDILITIRTQENILKSLYCSRHNLPLAALGANLPISRRLCRCRALGFNSWIDLMLEHPEDTWLGLLHFDKVFQCWADVFGDSHVHVLPYEWVQRGDARADEVMQRLFPQACQALSSSLRIRRYRTLPSSRMPRLRRLRDRFWRRTTDYAGTQGGLHPDSIRYSDATLESLRNFFRLSNRSMARIAGYHLHALGYAT